MLATGLAASPQAAEPLRGVGLQALADDTLRCLPEDPKRAILSLDVAVGKETPEQLGATVASAADHARVVAVLLEGEPVDARSQEQLDRWVGDVEALATAGAGRVAAWVVGASQSSRDDEAESFFLRRTSIAIHAAQPDALILSASTRARPGGSIADAVAPFVDAQASRLDASPDAPVMLAIGAVGAEGTWRALIDATRRGVQALTIQTMDPQGIRNFGEPECSNIRRALATWLAAFPDDAAPSSEPPPVAFPAEVPVDAKLLVVASDLSSRVIFQPTADGKLPGAAMIVRLTEEPISPRLFDPKADAPLPLEVTREGRRFALKLPLVHRPLVLAWDRAEVPDESKEQVQVAAVREPSVEEILANHFARQAAHDRRLEHYVADVVTEMGYAIGASGQSFEVRVEGRYFHDAGGEREFENRHFYINGAAWDPKHGRIPELPMIQPEKVQVLPLELRLDKSYEYHLRGKTKRQGRPCWEVGFQPTDPAQAGLLGTAFIDAATWDLLELSVSHSKLEPPVLSNQQTDSYGPVLAPDGEHWLAQKSDVHRVITLLGASIGVTIRMTFSNFVVNGSDFEAERAEARASDHQMLRDTEKGLVYLERTPDGERVPAKVSSRKLFFLFGARHDESYEGIIPLAGVNWLDYDLGGHGLQFNAFLAGAVNSVSISDPTAFGSRLTLTADAFVPLIKRSDRYRIPESGIDEGQVVSARLPHVGLEVSGPAGRHGRVGASIVLRHESWGEADDTAADFVPPHDVLVTTLGLTGEVHGRGWDGRLSGSRGIREGWEPWGLVDASGHPPRESGETTDYWRWDASLSKTFSLTRLQTVDVQLQALGGSGLDRFSRYEFSAFGGERLPGFDGTGIHFDRAALVRLSWGVDILGALGLDLEVGFGRTWTDGLPADVEAEFGEGASHVGVALVGTVPGPWGTLVRFDIGTPVYSSDYADVEGDLVGQIVVLKLLR
jgi:hypothetical protein